MTMSPALPSAMAILQISAHYAWMEGTWLNVHTFVGLLEESNILEKLASSLGSPIFLRKEGEPGI